MVRDKGYVRGEIKAEEIRGWISGKIALVVVIEINELGVTDIFPEPGKRINIVLAPVRGQVIRKSDRRKICVTVTKELPHYSSYTF